MPAKTPKEARFMRGCEHNPGAMKGKCPSKAVAKEFNHTSKTRTTASKNKPQKK